MANSSLKVSQLQKLQDIGNASPFQLNPTENGADSDNYEEEDNLTKKEKESSKKKRVKTKDNCNQLMILFSKLNI